MMTNTNDWYYSQGRVTVEELANVNAAPAKPRPTIVASLAKAMDAYAMMLPWKLLDCPSEALEPTAQNTLAALAPLVSVTVVSEEMERALPAWKIH